MRLLIILLFISSIANAQSFFCQNSYQTGPLADINQRLQKQFDEIRALPRHRQRLAMVKLEKVYDQELHSTVALLKLKIANWNKCGKDTTNLEIELVRWQQAEIKVLEIFINHVFSLKITTLEENAILKADLNRALFQFKVLDGEIDRIQAMQESRILRSEQQHRQN